jgi:decaprenylphospho-beta-D-ribofuranose 2-oxidase
VQTGTAGTGRLPGPGTPVPDIAGAELVGAEPSGAEQVSAEPVGTELVGWGRTAPSAARVITPSDPLDVGSAVARAGRRGIVARGLGRSYGDAAQNSGGDVLITTALDRILAVDLEAGTVRVEAGVSLDRLMRTLVPLGLWPAVTPGTRQVTVGGAIGADVHGKNHHRDGGFAEHVESLVIHTPAGGATRVGPDRDPELFRATTGGMGLTGVVLEATLRLLRIETSTMRVERQRLADLDTLMARMLDADAAYRYSVAWIDCLATGAALGRSILELGDHARRDELPAGRRDPSHALSFAPAERLVAPPWAPSQLLNRWSVAAFNECWYRRAPKRIETHLQPAASFFHPLDAVRDWNRLYGRRGLVQYQMVLPDGQEATLRQVLEALAGARCASFLGVLKRLGRASAAPLSFPRQGWTLALDIPAGAAGLRLLLDRIDDMVAAAGGRVYLAKDSRLRPELLEPMYPRLPEWRSVCDRVDPDRCLRSDLTRRLPLREPLG